MDLDLGIGSRVAVELATLGVSLLGHALDDSTPSPSPGNPAPPAISVPVAIVLGLIASFIQSLGIALQRGSHLQNDALPPAQRRVELRRPRWLIGFAIFMIGTVSTVLQIGALPIVILAPLGAVSLLYNAVLARFLLNTTFSKFMVAGTALITAGAVLIALFGAITESPHSLDELLRLFARPPFVACSTVLLFVLFCVLFIAHLAEWQLQIRIFRVNLGPDYWKHRRSASGSHHHSKKMKKKSSRGMRRRWSAPTLAPLAEVNENASGIATPAIANADEAARRAAGLGTYSPAHSRGGGGGGHRTRVQHYGATTALSPPSSNNGGTPSQRRVAAHGGPGTPSSDGTMEAAAANQSANGTTPTSDGTSSPNTLSTSHSDSSIASSSSSLSSAPGPTLADLDPGIRRTKTLLAVAYAGASGTLSGACLLLAKSGIELVVLSLAGGQNQFGRWQSWALVGVMLAAALLQLWYLNKALRFESPVLVMPLAFCFYNTASIALGLVYFDQLGALAWWNICLVILGTIILLMGVWVVSLHTEDEVKAEEREEEEALVMSASPIALGVAVSLPAVEADGPEGEEDDGSGGMGERQPLLGSVVAPGANVSPERDQTTTSVSTLDSLTTPPRFSPGGRAMRRRAQSLATTADHTGGGGPAGGMLSPGRFHLARRTPPERRAVHFLSRSASLSLGLGFAPAMQEEEDEEGAEGEEVRFDVLGGGGGGGRGRRHVYEGDLESGTAGPAGAGSYDGAGAAEPSPSKRRRSGGSSAAAGVGAAASAPSAVSGHARDASAGSVTGSGTGGSVPQLSYSSFLKRGLSIGIGVGSPGFYVQPTGIRSAEGETSPEGASSGAGASGADAGLLRRFYRFRIGRRRPSMDDQEAAGDDGAAGPAAAADMSRARRTGRGTWTKARLRPGRSASETDVADAYLEEAISPREAVPAATALAAEGEDEEPMERLIDVGDTDEHDAESGTAGDSDITVRTQRSAAGASSTTTGGVGAAASASASGWGTELDADALVDRLGQLAGWERMKRMLGLGGGGGGGGGGADAAQGRGR
ncbi:hypothetical protein OC844_006071 [Tilletia horrida]|nr:hypothetical protein OC844_006071 [Tilletia horrida]